MKLFIILLLACFLMLATQPKPGCSQVVEVFRVLQNNFLGEPVIHKEVQWKFDPDVSKKRRAMFYNLHGYRGDKLIERLGVGIDGNEDQRLAYQRARDEGHLGGLNYYRN